MTALIRPAPVRRTLAVKAAPEKAFTIFAAHMGRWWPKTHSVAKSPTVDVVVEPRVGGGWYEIGEDGTRCEWGRVLVYEPPSRLVLAWQIGADWTFDPTLVTEVELRFVPAEGGGTIVEFEHRGLENFGERAEEVRGMIDSPGGWTGVLSGFVLLAEAADRA